MESELTKALTELRKNVQDHWHASMMPEFDMTKSQHTGMLSGLRKSLDEVIFLSQQPPSMQLIKGEYDRLYGLLVAGGEALGWMDHGAGRLPTCAKFLMVGDKPAMLMGGALRGRDKDVFLGECERISLEWIAPVREPREKIVDQLVVTHMNMDPNASPETIQAVKDMVHAAYHYKPQQAKIMEAFSEAMKRSNEAAATEFFRSRLSALLSLKKDGTSKEQRS